MKKLLSGLVVLLVFSGTTSGLANVVQDRVKEKAQECSSALLAENYGRLADLTYPKVVQMTGGREKMIAYLRSGTTRMKADGSVILSTDIGNPSAVTAAGPDLFSVVPTDTEMKVKGGKLKIKSFMIAVSSDAGKTWSFIDGGDVDDQKIRTVLPNLPATLKLPAREKPILVRE
jgi:hypothetical protein